MEFKIVDDAERVERAASKWQPVVDALLAGRTVQLTGVSRRTVYGVVEALAIGKRARTHQKGDALVVWLEDRE